MKAYFFNVLLGLDLFGSAVLGGKPGETLSGRAGAAQAQGKLRGKILAPLIDLIMRDPKHCANAVRNDMIRAQAVITDDSKVVPLRKP